MLLASLALSAALLASPPAPPSALAPAIAHAAPAPCNPDAMKSIACTAQRHTPSPRAAASVPIACNPDPLKGAACHAHVAQARAETRSNAARGDELAAVD